MKIEIITIGREILDGRVVDTNSAFFGQELSKVGRVPRYFQRVDDIEGDIISAFQLASSRATHVIVSGGLGPTSDDITAEVFAKFLGRKWIVDVDAQEHLRSTFERMNRPLHDSQWKQAKLPEGAKMLPNPYGTAPGFCFLNPQTQWFFVPGVPREMKPMFVNHVLPKIPKDETFVKKMWITHFTSEGELQQRLKDVIEALPSELSFFYRTRFPENHLGLSGSLNTPELVVAFDHASKQITDRLGADVYVDQENTSLEALVCSLALKNHVQLVTVESCTGGLVVSRLTDVPGSSAVVAGGFVSYSNQLKQDLAESAGLGEEMQSALKDFGAVSQPVAELMAMSGAKTIINSSPGTKVLCIATTGIAGPGGGSTQKPVGTCWLAISNGDRVLDVQHFQGRMGLERDQLKLLFSQKALDMLRLQLLK